MSADCVHHAARPRPSSRQIAVALAAAEVRARAAGQRLTAPRRRAFELLVAAGAPTKAYDLMAHFKDGTATAPPTVYRALDALVGMGLAHRIASLNAYIACHGVGAAHAASFLICDCCGAVEEIGEPTADLLHALEQPSAFRTRTLEAHGRCRGCQG
jgi:Fur family zinc uptake transcriptional regulator